LANGARSAQREQQAAEVVGRLCRGHDPVAGRRTTSVSGPETNTAS
jgi:hypothetical protein